MNIMGRILVILNLLFALVTGGFLVVDFATRTNWKKAYEDLEREVKVSKANTDQMAEAYREQASKLAKAQTELAKARDDLKAAEVVSQTIIKKGEEKAQDSQNAVALERLSKTQIISENERFRSENKALQDVIKQREQRIIGLESEKDQYFVQAQQAVNERDQALARNDSLLKRIRELEIFKAKTEVASTVAGTTLGKSGGDVNPPATYVKGIVEKVDATDGSLVQLSIGGDAGLEAGHTLEVYRLRPEPEYLGQVRVLEVDPHKAVARLLRATGGRNPLRPGDEVASSLRLR